jgi:hypothetical protein
VQRRERGKKISQNKWEVEQALLNAEGTNRVLDWAKYYRCICVWSPTGANMFSNIYQYAFK